VRAVKQIAHPEFVVPEGLCDTHMHVFGPVDDYPAVANARYDWPGATLEQYLDIADHLSIARVVFVQPSYYGADNRCMFDAMRRVSRPHRAVIFLPDEVTSRELDAMHEIGVRGLRLDLFRTADEGASLADMEMMLDRAAALAAPLGWHVEIYGPGHITHQMIAAFGRMRVPVSINHFGYMSQAEGMGDAHFQDFVSLVGSSGCWVKLTAPYRLKPASAERATWMGRQLIDAAPDRIIWGTDWPHIPQGSLDTGALFNELLNWCPNEARRNAILVDNPARLYGFD